MTSEAVCSDVCGVRSGAGTAKAQRRHSEGGGRAAATATADTGQLKEE